MAFLAHADRNVTARIMVPTAKVRIEILFNILIVISEFGL